METGVGELEWYVILWKCFYYYRYFITTISSRNNPLGWISLEILVQFFPIFDVKECIKIKFIFVFHFVYFFFPEFIHLSHSNFVKIHALPYLKSGSYPNKLSAYPTCDRTIIVDNVDRHPRCPYMMRFEHFGSFIDVMWWIVYSSTIKSPKAQQLTHNHHSGHWKNWC